MHMIASKAVCKWQPYNAYRTQGRPVVHVHLFFLLSSMLVYATCYNGSAFIFSCVFTSCMRPSSNTIRTFAFPLKVISRRKKLAIAVNLILSIPRITSSDANIHPFRSILATNYVTNISPLLACGC